METMTEQVREGLSHMTNSWVGTTELTEAEKRQYYDRVRKLETEILAARVVKAIIDSGGGRANEYYLVETVKNRISPTQLFNHAIAAGTVTKDGVENIHLGAKAVLETFLADLPSGYRIKKKGRGKAAMRLIERTDK